MSIVTGSLISIPLTKFAFSKQTHRLCMHLNVPLQKLEFFAEFIQFDLIQKTVKCLH